MLFQSFSVILVIVPFYGIRAYTPRNTTSHEVRKIPDRFLFGAASAAYQVEGAWNKDGKSESIWDHDTHQMPSPIDDQSTGDIADDSYHLYKRDVEMIRELGLDFYRFSLAWTRILPTSFPNKINQAAVEYYNNLIDELLKYNIQPMVTIFHWDLPQKLQQMGGWTNSEIIDWYSDYARIAFKLFGDRVKLWITINEPTQVCYHGYGSENLAPRLNIPGFADYMCAKNLLLAHAKAYHIYDQEFRPSQGGNIFISLSCQWHEPESEEYVTAALQTMSFDTDIYAHPIFSEVGGWPEILKDRVAARSKELGFPRSRLPELSKEEIETIRGTSDYYGLNHYSTFYVNKNVTVIDNYEKPSRADDMDANLYQYNEWAIYATDTVKYTPWGFYKLLMYIKKTYGNPSILITENGLGSDLGLDDGNRVIYYRGYIGAMLDAIDEGAKIIGYSPWCLMDNFEWSKGYTVRYGLYEVNYTSPMRTRTPRKSAFLYKEIVRTRTLDPHFEPYFTVMTIDEGH